MSKKFIAKIQLAFNRQNTILIYNRSRSVMSEQVVDNNFINATELNKEPKQYWKCFLRPDGIVELLDRLADQRW